MTRPEETPLSKALAARLSPVQASRLARILCLLLGVGFLGACFSHPIRIFDTPFPPEDLRLYRSVVDDVRQGASYHDAALVRLRSGKYPIDSVFRWRLPTYAWAGALLPSHTAVLGALVTLLIAAGVVALVVQWRICGGGGMLVMTLWLAGLAWWLKEPNVAYSHELWAGLLLLAAASLYALRWHWPALAAALAALFLREHALPFCLVAGGLAWQFARRLEAAAWLAGIAAFFIFLAWHAVQVQIRVPTAELARSEGVWGFIGWGGMTFVLNTVKVNALLYYLPMPVSYLVLAAALLGYGRLPTEFGLLLLGTVLSYVAALLVVGIVINSYWGLVYSPLLAFGLAQVPAAAREVCSAAWSWKPPATGSLADR